MKDGRTSTESRLFITVNSLSKRELAACKEAIFPSTKREWKQYHFIFDKCIKSKTEDQFLTSVSNEKGIKSTSRYLCEKIIETLAELETGLEFSLKVFDIALQKEILWVAKSTLGSLIESVIEFEKTELIKAILTRKTILERIYGISVALPQSWTSAKLFQEQQRKYRALVLQEKLKEILKNGGLFKRNQFSNHESEITTLINYSIFSSTRVEALKAGRNWALLNLELERAQSYQAEILGVMRSVGSYSHEEVLFESIRYSSFLISTRSFDKAQKELMEFGAFPASNEKLEQYIETNWIKYSLFLFASNGNVQMGEKVIRDFKRVKGRFSGRWKGLLYHAISIIYLYGEQWEEIVAWQNRLARLKKNDISDLLWTGPVFRFISYLEMGDQDKAKDQLNQLSQEAHSTKTNYLTLLLQMFDSILEGENSIDLNVAKHWETLESLDNSPEDSPFLTILDVRNWIWEYFAKQGVKLQKSVLLEPSYFSIHLA